MVPNSLLRLLDRGQQESWVGGGLSTFLQRARRCPGPCKRLRAPRMAGRMRAESEGRWRVGGPFSCVLLIATLSPACAELQVVLRATVLILPRKTFQN